MSSFRSTELRLAHAVAPFEDDENDAECDDVKSGENVLSNFNVFALLR